MRPTIKYRISGTTLATAPQATGGATAGEPVRTLSERYPGSSALYSVPSALQAADTPQPVRFTTVDQILIKVRTPGEIPMTLDQVQALLRQRRWLMAPHAILLQRRVSRSPAD